MAREHSSRDKKKHKKKKSRKHRKEKQHKKKKLANTSDSSDSSDSISPDSKTNLEKGKDEFSSRSEWNFLDKVLSNSNNVIKNKKEKKRPSQERSGQNIRELNPYWKDGGCGLPPTKLEEKHNKMPESSLGNISIGSVSSDRDYSSSSSKNLSKIDLICDNKQSKSFFIKPGEGESFTLNKNTYQRNWKKKDSKELKNDLTEVVTVSKSEMTSSGPSEVLSDEDLNKLASKLVKAEIMGNLSLVNQLKTKLEAAKKSKDQMAKEKLKEKIEEVVILTDKDVKGKKSAVNKASCISSKRHKVNTHDSFGRICYFPDDDKYSLENLFEKEKRTAREDILLPLKTGQNLDELDDAYLASAASSKMLKKVEEREKRTKIKEAIVKHRSFEGCFLCLDNRKETKHLVVSTGNKCYLCLPEEESLTKGHCLIVPVQHEISTLHLDEDVWDEIKEYQRQLTQMFLELDQDVVFFENARSFKHFPHCLIHCVPLDKEMGNLAPIYFQKAISESETEWSNNKKLIDFRKKDLRRSIPKGLPFFAVSFGTEGGFAHIIEDEYLFKKNFGEEVLGGMLDLDARKWRKPQKENFRIQREKALEFLKIWKKFEVTLNSSGSDSSSSD